MRLKEISTTGLANDRRAEGWELIEDTPLEGNPELELREFLEPGEAYVTGDVMFGRAEKLGNRAGQQHAEHLLALQRKIPVEWRHFYLVFPGTKWRSLGGFLNVPYLFWRGDEWCLYWDWLDFGLPSYSRLVRCK